MPRPQIFVSSTYYDFQHIRASLEGFIERLGYEPILSEKGKIAYDPDFPLDESCYREASGANIFVLIIGGRYGSAASDENVPESPEFHDRYESITKKEYEAAVRKDIPIYILVLNSVFVEYELYRNNRENKTIKYSKAGSENIFRLLDDVLSKRRNNPLYQFNHFNEIENWLRDQWAGLFREMLSRRSEHKQLATLADRVDELSSINGSLQRYMEEIVKESTPETATEIIREEKEKQDEAKRKREFEKVSIVAELVEFYQKSLEEVEELFRDSKSIDEIALTIDKWADRQPSFLIKFWKERPDEARGWVNLGREALHLTPLDFANTINGVTEDKRPLKRTPRKKNATSN